MQLEITAIETFYRAAGWALFALGALHCVLPRSFRLGVVLMLIGDACLAIAIAFPKKAAEIFALAGIDLTQFPADLTIPGLIFALALTAAFYRIFMRFFHFRPLWQRASVSVPKDDRSAAGESAAADPAIFAQVKLNKVSDPSDKPQSKD